MEGQSLMEMLDRSINRYRNKVITAAEVSEELIKLSKTIVEKDEDARKMGLSTYEYAFYTAVANNDSAKELMGKDKLRELAVVLTETIRKNATIDRTIKENVRAKMKVAVKRLCPDHKIRSSSCKNVALQQYLAAMNELFYTYL